MALKVETITTNLHWSFNSEGPSIPMQAANGSWYWEYNIDPFPCYTHKEDHVRYYMKLAISKFRSGKDVNVFIMPYESKARWNGFCDADHDWQVDFKEGDDVCRPFHHRIVMAGKRTPIHPAMTRFVTVHEYGHAIVKWVAYKLGYADCHKFYQEVYATLRPFDAKRFVYSYGAGEWHAHPGEIAADDFRILLCEVETEHWPHPDSEYPTDVPDLKKWWLEMRELYHVEA